MKVAQRLRDAISETGVPIGDSQVCVTISLGVAGLEQGRSQGDDPREILELLIKQADEALYASKKAGTQPRHSFRASIPIRSKVIAPNSGSRPADETVPKIP